MQLQTGWSFELLPVKVWQSFCSVDSNVLKKFMVKARIPNNKVGQLAVSWLAIEIVIESPECGMDPLTLSRKKLKFQKKRHSFFCPLKKFFFSIL